LSESATVRYVQSSPARAKTTLRPSVVEASGPCAVAGTTANPSASVDTAAGAGAPGARIHTRAPGTGAPVDRRVTHTSEPLGETFALIPRSVTCAITASEVVRACRVPGRAV
jgi:hypothetical protein